MQALLAESFSRTLTLEERLRCAVSFAKADLGQIRAFLDREQSEHLVKGLRGAIVSIAHGDAEAAEYLGVKHDPTARGSLVRATGRRGSRTHDHGSPGLQARWRLKLYRMMLQVREKMTPDELAAADRVCFPPPTSF